MTNLNVAVICKWIQNGDVTALKDNYKTIVKSGKLKHPYVITVLIMCRPMAGSGEDELRAFYGKLLGEE